MSKWCEHCRGHYPTDHYDAEGEHLSGVGPTGRAIDAEVIVELLAAAREPVVTGSDGGDFCGLCENVLPLHSIPPHHDERCPWRMAREWQAATVSP